jgi:deoxyxylulose-5-phosphate synthase
MSRLLDTINSPDDLKKIPAEKLEDLAQEIRDELIRVTSKTGGHLGPNLGVVELTIAMHRVFETPKDNFIFDVSHQAYVHKLFTGRRKDFEKNPPTRRAQRVYGPLGKSARLLRCRACRNGAFRRPRDGHRPRPARVG